MLNNLFLEKSLIELITYPGENIDCDSMKKAAPDVAAFFIYSVKCKALLSFSYPIITGLIEADLTSPGVFQVLLQALLHAVSSR